jgi:hypothetical protein
MFVAEGRVLTMASLLTVSIVALQAETAIVLGMIERDLTGDGNPEILRVDGTGRTTDNLAVTFTIESAGRVVYQFELAPLTRTVGFDAGRRVISADEHRARIKEFGGWFFAAEKFQRPAQFVESLRGSAPATVAQIPEVIARYQEAADARAASVIWQEILESRVTVFTFSPGGDEIVAIGWSAQARRFYRLLECC